MKYDILIIGGGPAGMTAAIYALRANKTVLIIEKEVIGGKIASSPLIENYPGIQEIKGIDLSEQLQEQVTKLGGEIRMEEALKIEEDGKDKVVVTKTGSYRGKTVIVATGTRYKMLGLEKEKNFLGRGISFCATCDGFFYKGKTVAVIGGGNTALTNALELANICQKVYILQMLDYLTAETILIKRIQEKKNVEIIYGISITSWIGKEKIEGIEIEKAGKKEIIKVDGVFLAIGQIPETKVVNPMLHINEKEYIEANADMSTNIEGVFAAGDCVSKPVRQLTTAVNDGTIAAISAITYIDHWKDS